MRRWLMLGIAAIAVAMPFSACGEEEEAGTASPTVTVAATPAGTARATVTPPSSTATPRAATPTPKPPTPTPQARQPIWKLSQVSSLERVDTLLQDGLNNTYTIASVDPQWTQLEKWEIEYIADLDGDGPVEAMVFHFTGGAHCCSEYLVFSETPSGIELDDWFSLGNGGIGSVEDLDGDGVPELSGWDDRLSYFADQPYAASPSLPLVLCRTAEGKYAECTVQFPERMQDAADGFEAELRQAVQGQATDVEKRRAALGLVTAYLLLTPTDKGWTKVRSLCPECEDWLMQNYDELEHRLSYVPPATPMVPPAQ